MNPKFKIGLYALLLLGAIIFGVLFYTTYKEVNKPSDSSNYSPTPVPTTTTNNPAETTNSTNLVSNTNQVAETNVATNTAAPSQETATVTRVETPPQVATARETTKGRSAMVGYLAAFLGISIFLGLMIARDLSEYFGSHSVEFLFNDEGTGIKNPEYEEAEQEWANGHHLDAIRLMRDYLTRHPREQYVALRIAEIYEKDLKNYLAAVLEYEEILKNKLPPERWGWAAIHLCNLYSKLKKTDEAVALLRRIVNEYGETPAAEKARKRLAMFETVGEGALDADLPDSIQSAAPAPKIVKEPEPPESNLPPGFRPKK